MHIKCNVTFSCIISYVYITFLVNKILYLPKRESFRAFAVAASFSRQLPSSYYLPPLFLSTSCCFCSKLSVPLIFFFQYFSNLFVSNCSNELQYDSPKLRFCFEILQLNKQNMYLVFVGIILR